MSLRWITAAAVATVAICFAFAFIDGFNVAVAAAN